MMRSTHLFKIGRFLALTALILPTAPATLLAQPPGLHHGPHLFGPWAFEALELAPDQEESLRDLLGSHREAVEPRLAELRDARKALGEAIHADAFDEAAIREAAAAVNQIETELAVDRGRLAQSVRQILTPEQQAELEGMRKAGRLLGHRGRTHHPMGKSAPPG